MFLLVGLVEDYTRLISISGLASVISEAEKILDGTGFWRNLFLIQDV